MLEVTEFIASIFKRRLKLTKWEIHQVMCGRAEGNKLVVEYKEPKKTPYTLVVNTFDEESCNLNLKYHAMVIPNIIHHELEIGTSKYGVNSAGNDMYCLTITDTEKTIKHLYFKKELLKSVY